MSNRGFMPSLKCKYRFHRIVILEYESELEHDFLLILDQDPKCLDIQTQPVEITYRRVDGKEVTVVPDIWVLFDNGEEYLIEVKPESQLQKLIEDPNWAKRVEAIHEYCKKRNWKYLIVTDRKIKCARLNTIKNFSMAAKHFAPAMINIDIKDFDKVLKEILQIAPCSFSQLVTHLSTVLPMDKDIVISLLKYKLYFQVENELFFDWDVPFPEALVSLKGEMPVQSINLPDSTTPVDEASPAIPDTVAVLVDEEIKVNDRDERGLEEKYETIAQLINTHGKDAKRSQVKNFCEKHLLPFWPVYKTYLKWRKHGKAALAPKRVQSHKKSHVDPRVDLLLNEHIDNFLKKEWRQITGAYEAFRTSCNDVRLKPVSYEIFRRRVKKARAVEQRGKFKPRSQVYIPRALFGTYQEGRHPCCVIKMDHSLLDIWLVDTFTKKPISRPWLTLGIDENTGGIWCFYLSFDHPSQETVTQAILHGLLHKETTRDWKIFLAGLEIEGTNKRDHGFICPIGGFPARIQVDNGMDFRANSVKDFCMAHNITLEFRPIKTPEYGAAVEKVWDIINTAIKNDLLDGKVYSLPKIRQPISKPKFLTPPGHDAKGEAVHTFDSFREWLFSFIVTRLCSQPRGNNSLSPVERWRAGLTGASQHAMGGAVRYLSLEEYARVEFDTKITINPTLSPQGFRYHNIFYSAPWVAELRKDRVLVDSQKYPIKISHQDMRYAFFLDPVKNIIRILEAYKYDGDDEITNFLQQGLGKVPGYEPETISLTTLNAFKNGMGSSSINPDVCASARATSVETMKARGVKNKQERLQLEKMAKTEAGRSRIEQAKTLVRMDEKPVPEKEYAFDPETFAKPIEGISSNNEKERLPEKDEPGSHTGVADDLEIEAYPTDWDTIKERMDFVSFKEDQEK